jgi:P pilus assembly chaperone PapD
MKRFVLLAMCLALLVAGRSSAGTADLALSVDPMVFEFAAPYGGEQHATVHISNPGTVAETVEAAAIDWNVLSDGSVAILPANSSAHSLSRYLSVSPASFTLQPGETRPITVSVQLPAASGKAQPTMWSGFLLQASVAGAPGGITPGATVFVYDSTQARHPQLQFRVLRVSGRAQRRIVAHVVNTSQTYVRPVAHLVIRDGGKVVRDDVLPMNALLPGSDRWLSAPIPHLSRGRYQAELIVDYGGSILDGQTHVQIP